VAKGEHRAQIQRKRHAHGHDEQRPVRRHNVEARAEADGKELACHAVFRARGAGYFYTRHGLCEESFFAGVLGFV